jgi:hypothetical protein
MTQYYFGKMNLLQACNITNKEAVSCLTDGLVDRTLKNGAKAGRYGTPEQLYAEYLSTLVTETYEPQDTRPRSRFENKGFKPRLGERSIGAKPHKGTLEKSDFRCFNCQEPGHVFSKCPKPKRRCDTCKQLGHDK